MERLTKRGTQKNGYVSAIGSGFGCWGQIIDRLAAYEDTGLMPEEIKEVQEAMAPIPFGRFHDIMEAERAGRLVLPSEPNAPLTLEELREMALFEWLWVEVIHPSERQRFRNVASAYYQIYTDYTNGEALCCGWPGVTHEFEYAGYGKTWRAYRRKPEEGTI